MKKIIFIFISLFFIHSLHSQMCLGEDSLICTGQSVNISAICGSSSPVLLLDSMQQLSLTDDQYSGAINIGFSFTFYGNTYSQLLISSNNYISFDISQANGYSPWSITAAAPSPSLPTNIIMGPYQDINPGLGGTIEYGTFGTAPNRKFVVRYNQVPMFSCTQDLFCSTMILYENSNHIEMFIDNKPLCSTWNNGVAIEGIQDITGTIATVVVGRNFPTQWTAFADGISITPTSPSNYAAATIPYVPSLLQNGIQWFDTDGNFLGTGFEITVTPTNDTTGYYVVYDQCFTASGGQGNTDTAWVYADQPDIFATGSSLNCIDTVGTATAFANGAAPFIYQWNDPQVQTTSIATGLSSGTYIVTVTDTNNCTNQAIAVVDSATYTLTTFSEPTLCNGDSSGMAFLNVSPLDTFVTYLWDANASAQTGDTAYHLSAGAYQVVITDSIGCKDSATVTVSEPNPIIIIDSLNHPLCTSSNDGSISVNVAGGTAPYFYSWGSNQQSGLTAGSYTLTVTDSNNCQQTDTFVLINPQPITIILDTISASCGLNDGMITATVQGGTPSYTYFWNPGGIGFDTLMNLSTGWYNLTVTDNNGCSVIDSIFLNEYKNYTVDFSINPDQGIAPLTIQFFNTSTNCSTYYWDFGNGNTSILPSPSDEIYTQEGEYLVTLVGCNSSGLDRCCDTITQTVMVENHSFCSWTNVFTPNGDNKNDEFVINCDKIVEFNIKIFNRWGNKVYESNNIEDSWNGDNASEGTYFFVINAVGIDDLTWSHKGAVSLIR